MTFFWIVKGIFFVGSGANFNDPFYIVIFLFDLCDFYDYWNTRKILTHSLPEAPVELGDFYDRKIEQKIN